MRGGESSPVWLLIGPSQGESSQQRVLAQALGVPYHEVALRRGAELPDLKPQQWPKVVISFGKGLGAALDLRSRSGKYTEIVHLGCPKSVNCEDLALIITMPQDRFPKLRNVIRLGMPLNGEGAPVVPVPLPRGMETFPHPWVAVFVGGQSNHHLLGAQELQGFLHAVETYVQGQGGSIFLSTSPRTSGALVSVIKGYRFQVPFRTYEYAPGAPNPLADFLRFGDEFIVTGDSASMIADVYRTRRRVGIYRLPARLTWKRALERFLPWKLQASLIRHGVVSAPRDFQSWYQKLAQMPRIWFLNEMPAPGLLGSFWQALPRKRASYDTDDHGLPLCVQAISQILGDKP